MQWYEILIIVCAVAFVVEVVVWQIVRRKKGKGCCDCSACSAHCSACRAAKEKESKESR